MDKNFLNEVRRCILSDDALSLWDIIETNKNTIIPHYNIEKLLFDICPTQKINADIHLTGQGGSKKIKPNLTTLTAYYLGLCGYNVVKTGSIKKTSALGSTDFVVKIKSKYPVHWNCSNIKYYDIDYCSPWLKYRNILEQCYSFSSFFSEYIFNECKAKSKFVGVLGPDAIKIRNQKTILNPPNKEITLYTQLNNFYLDEIVIGNVFINNHLHITIPRIKYPIISFEDVDIINTKLLLGLDENSYWYESLKLSVSLIIHFASDGRITHRAAEKMFINAYKFSKKLTLEKNF